MLLEFLSQRKDVGQRALRLDKLRKAAREDEARISVICNSENVENVVSLN